MTANRNIAAFAFVMLLSGAAPGAFAQQLQGVPAQDVEVDLGALDAGPIPPGQYDQSHLPLPAKRLVPLVAPTTTTTSLIGANRAPQALVAPAAPPPPSSVVPVPPPVNIADEPAQEAEAPLPPIQNKVMPNANIVAPEKNEIVSFPMETKVRSESSNPALAPSVPVPPPASVKETIEQQPVVQAQETPPAFEVPVVPPPRQMPAKANANRPSDNNRILSVPVKPQPTPPPVQVAAPPQPKKHSISPEALMAASPTGIIRAKPRDLSGDELAARIVNTDKQSLTRKIEEISRQVESRPAAKSSTPPSSRQAPLQKSTSAPRMITVPAQPLEAPQIITPIVQKKPAQETKFEEKILNAEDTSKEEILTPLPDITAVEEAAPPQKEISIVKKQPVQKIAAVDTKASGSETKTTLPFAEASDEIDGAGILKLEQSVLPILRNNQNLRLQIQCFATPTDTSVSSARRLSLARGLAIRTWLMDNGIPPTRMDIRALGSESSETPLDRADLIFFDPLK